MTAKKHRVCVLGNFSGRNAGDNAILGCLMHDVAVLYPDVRFVVPTFNPGFVRRHYAQYDVEPVSLKPWALSLKIFGLPIFRAVLSADLVLVTDNILFDMKLYNPLFNYLSTLSLVLPLAKRRSIPVVLYNMSLGPVKTPAGKRMFERVIKSCDQIILRDEQSRELLNRLGLPYPRLTQAADCAVNARPVGSDRLRAIMDETGAFHNPKGTIGFNINAYLDAYLRGDRSDQDRQLFSEVIAKAVDQIIDATGADVLFFVTQVMDMKITMEAVNRVCHRDQVHVVGNKDYSYEELTALLSQVELLVAMRTHAVILASSVCTPVVGIISYPKTAGYLKTIEQDQWMIAFDELTTDRLAALTLEAYRWRGQTREAMKPIIQREKAKASHSAMLLSPYLGQPQPVAEVQAG